MNCTNCTEAKPIPVCTGELLIGTFEIEETEVFVFVQNIATGYIATHRVTPNEYDSSVSIPLDDPYPDFYSPNFYFKLWVSEKEDGNTILPVMIDEVEHECFTIIFKQVYSSDSVVKIDNVTLSV